MKSEICLIALAAAAWLGACNSASSREPALGLAYAGPESLQIRAALAARSPRAATVRHGERLEIIGRRRRFYKVRTQGGQVGWADGRQLLSTEDINALKSLAERAARAPSQGTASAFDPLNIHIAANRQAPSFRQIKPDTHVDVIAHETAPRVPYLAPEFIHQQAPKAPRQARGKDERLAPPPAGPAPALPANWRELSRTPPPPASGAGPPVDPVPAAANKPPEDLWTLVRMQDGRAGWALARMLMMSIPDEVAQYAERARITAFFRIGETRAENETKPAWLWAAQSQPRSGFDFDSLRIFSWNAKRQRYETSFIERNIRGYLPVIVEGRPGGVKGFNAVVEEKTGRTALRHYAVQGTNFRARIVSRDRAARPPSWRTAPAGRAADDAGDEAEEKPQWGERLAGWLARLKARFSR